MGRATENALKIVSMFYQMKERERESGIGELTLEFTMVDFLPVRRTKRRQRVPGYSELFTSCEICQFKQRGNELGSVFPGTNSRFSTSWTTQYLENWRGKCKKAPP